MNTIQSSRISIQQADTLAKRLQPHYSRFRVHQRLLFTGHSHQCWPDVAFDAIREYEELVIQKVDRKWGDVMNKVEVMRNYLRQYYDDPDGLYCRENNTHSLLVSWLSSLDLLNKPKIITTDGQFHSLYRQLQSISKSFLSIEIITVPVQPVQTLSIRIIENINDKTAAVMCSRVFFQSSQINFHLKTLYDACQLNQVCCFVDDYHGTNAVPLSITNEGLNDIFIVTGGYKYLQWGEGNCFLRFPKSYNRKPILTGWFASFGQLAKQRNNQSINFDGGNQIFSSATFEPVSVFRGAKVAQFFKQQGLTSEVLRKHSLTQHLFLRQKFKQMNIQPNHIKLMNDFPINKFGGFVSFYSQKAQLISQTLMSHGVLNDSRGKILRLGCAPYITTTQIEECLKVLQTCIKQLF